MKKYFALFSVVLMLAVAGVAMAADSDGGHVTPTPTPVVDPNSGSSGSGTATTAVQTQTTTVQNVVVVVTEAIKAISAASVTQSTADSVKESLTTAAADSGMTAEQIAYWTEQAETIQATVEAAINNLTNSVAAFAGAEVVTDADALEVTALTGSLENLIAEASAKLKQITSAIEGAQEQTAISVLPNTKPKKTGVHKISLPTFKRAMFGLPIIFHANRKGGSTRGASVFAAATDGEAVFLNSNGTQVTVVPDGNNGEMPGFVTAAVYMEAGAEYEPVIATTTAAAQAKTSLTETKASVSVTEEVVVASTATFSTYVKSSLLEGTNYVTIPVSAVLTTGWTDSASETAYKTADSSFDVFTVAALPAITAPATATWYIAAVSFDRGSKTASDLYTGAALEFFPNNVAGEPDQTAKFFKEESGKLVDLTVADVFGATSRYTRGYVAFQLSAAATKPAVATDVKKATTNPDPTPTPTPFNPGANPGSSSGGCDAGFSVLALAVLGGFMVTRRK